MIDCKKVIGFWHICMINDFADIVKEQTEIIIRSGLCWYLDEIHITCLGASDDINRAMINVNRIGNSKLNTGLNLYISYHSENINEYEFPTLKRLQRVCQESIPFYGVYFHTKGVSYPGNEGGKYWRDYLNHYILREWKKNIDNLKLGYDLSGVKLLSQRMPPAGKLHYSGNFWWFRSEYIKTLNDVDALDKTNRYDAEMWVGSNYPIAATLCQNFVDYNTKGVFKP